MQALSMHAPAMVPTVARVRTQVQPRQLLLPPALPDSMHQHAVPDLPPEQVSDIAGGHLMPSCSMPVPLLQQESALRELLALAWGTIPSKDAASSLGGMHAENASSRKARGGTFVMPAGGSPSVDMHGFGQQAPYILPLADMPDKEIALYRQRLEQYLYSSQFRQHAEKLLSVRRTTLSSTASSTGSVLDSPDVLSKGNGGTRTARSLAHRHLLPRGVLVVAGGPRLLANLVVLLKARWSDMPGIAHATVRLMHSTCWMQEGRGLDTGPTGIMHTWTQVLACCQALHAMNLSMNNWLLEQLLTHGPLAPVYHTYCRCCVKYTAACCPWRSHGSMQQRWMQPHCQR